MKKSHIDIEAIRQLHQSGNLEEAREGYLFFLKKNPNHVEALHALAILSVQLEKFNEGLEYIRTAIELQPNNALLYLHLANILKIQGSLTEAENVLLQIIDLDPSCISAYNNLGSVYYAQGKITDAIYFYREALSKQPDFVDAHYNLGIALIKNNQLDAAIDVYEELLTHVPDHFAARFHLACTYMRLEKLPAAEQQFLRIIEVQPYHFESQMNIATCYLKQGALIEAKKHYLNALALPRQDTQVLFNLGVINTQLGHLDYAIQDYQRALKIDPDYFEAHNNLGAVFILKQHAGLALHHFKEALRIQPHNEAIRYTVDALSKNQLQLAAPSDYITTLFDAYADHYDAHLLKALDYQVPMLLYDAVKEVTTIPSAQWDILDLGCGTGLCGIPFKSTAKTLTGVDLSTKMLDVARDRQIYTELMTQDIFSFLVNTDKQYDLILAGDVFVYMGDLQIIFRDMSHVLRPQGLCAFNAEITGEGDFVMNQSGRFLHSKHYIDQLAEKNYLKVVSYKIVITRLQNNEPVYGHVYVLQSTNDTKRIL